MIRSLLVIILVFSFQSCSKGLFESDIEKNLKAMDKIHGHCNNPYRTFTKKEKLLCENKERAAGPDGEIGEPINITKMIEDFRSGGSQGSYQGMTVNKDLWGASLILLDQYPLDIVDSQGGFISTGWIIKKEIPNQRCLIKVNVTSQELVSNGVKVKLLCEEKDTDTWYQDGLSYLEEEKNLILKILNIANQLSVTEKLS